MDAIRLPVMKSASAHDTGSLAHRDRELVHLANELQARIAGEVRVDRHYRMLYATDASIYQVEPVGVVIPTNLDDVRATVRFAAEHGIALLPRGGGTSLAGQTVNNALVIDLSRHCTAVLDIDSNQRRATVEPGIILEQLNRALAPHGLMFGPDVATAAQATIGGMIGNNSAGAHSILYGRTVENLRAADVMLADGTELRLDEGAALRDPRVAEITRRVATVVHSVAGQIRERYPKTKRRVDGYNLDLMLDQMERSQTTNYEKVNLAHLVCGSEGTLAVTLRAELDLVSTPKNVAMAIVAFDNVEAALMAVGPILETNPSAVELVDDVIIHLAARNSEYRRYIELLPQLTCTKAGVLTESSVPGAVLYVEYFGDAPGDIDASFAKLGKLFERERIIEYRDPAAMAGAWKLRKAGEPLLYGMPGERKPITFIEDTAVEPAKLVEFIREFRALLEKYNTYASYYAHASVGCLHIRPLIALASENGRETMQKIAEEATDLVKQFGGALSGEHGDGRLRSHLLRRFFGDEISDAFRRIKDIFDPELRLNPGNIVDPPGMTESLRVRPKDEEITIPQREIRTFFRYRSEHGFAEAATLCNGAGICRKTRGGTMCPSYRATRDERHATRGRGNALRLAISGQFDTDGLRSGQMGGGPLWNDPATLETFDLCLSCKACKSECPSNVDIARLKSEYLAQSYLAGRKVPGAVKMFADVRKWNARGSALHPIANFLSRSPLQAIAKQFIDIHPKRSLPPLGPSLFKWYKNRPAKNAGGPAVILFPDCFTSYSEPHIGRAAITVLESFGYRVVLPGFARGSGGCCGRPKISLGLLKDAIPHCAEVADLYMELMERENAVALIGLEPSCVSAIVDDWLDLKIDVDQVQLRELAERTLAIEDFLELHWDAHPNREKVINAAFAGPPVLLHGHCHQKALWGVDRTASLLWRVCGDRLRVLDSGCCGMAGAFGFTLDHYDLSMAVGETSLFPFLREEPEATILAPGTSCRHQVHDALNREAKHPIEFIAGMLQSRVTSIV